MRWLKDMKIGTRLMFAFGGILILLFIQFSILSLKISNVREAEKKLQQESIVVLLDLMDAEYQLELMKENIGDYSLTGNKNALNEAEINLNNVKIKIDEIKKIKTNFSDFDEVSSSSVNAYKIGLQMAEAYLAKKMDEGNLIMKEFDSKSESVILNLSNKISEEKEVMKKGMENSNDALNQLQTTAAAIFIFILIFGIVIAILMARSLSGSVDKINSVLNKMVTGDISQEIDLNSKNEIGEMAKSFNEFVDKLNGIISDLLDYANKVASGSQQLEATMQEMKTNSDDVGRTSENSSSAIQEMAGTVENIARNTEHVSTNVNEAVMFAEEGGKSVREAISEMGRIKDVVDSGARNVKQLGTKTNEIGEIITVINDIASQTNLLALNAAIEAARAGEAGKGFEVVAEEVRKLAEKTTEATKEIAKMIKEIQLETNNVIRGMEEATAEVEEGVRLVDNTGDVLERIVYKVEEVKDMISTIANASKEQAIATDEIATQAEVVSTSVTAMNSMLGQSVDAIKDVSYVAEKLNEIVRIFRLKSGYGQGYISSKKSESKKLKQFDNSSEKQSKGTAKTKSKSGNSEYSSSNSFIKWDSDFLVGVKIIDDEHKELIEKINELVRAIESGKARNEVENILNFLQEYTDRHFADEEDIMVTNNYPDYEKQRKAHEVFRKNVIEYKAEFNERGATPSLVVKIKKNIGEWFANHIKVMDKKIGTYMKENKMI